MPVPDFPAQCPYTIVDEMREEPAVRAWGISVCLSEPKIQIGLRSGDARTKFLLGPPPPAPLPSFVLAPGGEAGAQSGRQRKAPGELRRRLCWFIAAARYSFLNSSGGLAISPQSAERRPF
jgi:hypothetical protein